ncbi:hypothetical protein ABFX02_02G180700 [Erythranthe guttata]
MNQDQAQPPPALQHHRKRLVGVSVNKKLAKYAAYSIILVSCYLIGYLSNKTQTTNNNIHHQQINPTPTTAVDVDDDHNRFSTQCGRPIGSEQVRERIMERVFNGSSPWLNFPPEHVKPLLRPHRIKGWGSNGAVFENLIRKVRPRIIIEVGTFLGASAIHMAGLTKKLGLNDTQIVCIDDFRGWPGGFQKKMEMVNGDVLVMYQFMQNVVHSKATESIVMLPFSTSSALEKLCEWGVLGELVEVDAGHDFHSAWSDINKGFKVLRPGGVIFGHDYFTSADNRGVRRAVHLFARLHNLQIKLDGQHWLIHTS